MAKKLKWLRVVARIFLTGDIVKKDKCDRCGTDLEKIKMEKAVEYLCDDCTKKSIFELCARTLAPKVDEVVNEANEKIEEKAEKIDETLAKAEEVATQVEEIKGSVEVVKEIFKDKK